MSFESGAIKTITEAFDKEDLTVPPMHWEHGTLWVDTNSEEDMDLIAETLENDYLSADCKTCLLYTSPSPRDGLLSRMPSSA